MGSASTNWNELSTPLLADANSPFHFFSYQTGAYGRLARAESNSVSKPMEGTRNFGILDGDGDNSTVNNREGRILVMGDMAWPRRTEEPVHVAKTPTWWTIKRGTSKLVNGTMRALRRAWSCLTARGRI